MPDLVTSGVWSHLISFGWFCAGFFNASLTDIYCSLQLRVRCRRCRHRTKSGLSYLPNWRVKQRPLRRIRKKKSSCWARYLAACASCRRRSASDQRSSYLEHLFDWFTVDIKYDGISNVIIHWRSDGLTLVWQWSQIFNSIFIVFIAWVKAISGHILYWDLKESCHSMALTTPISVERTLLDWIKSVISSHFHCTAIDWLAQRANPGARWRSARRRERPTTCWTTFSRDTS